jgi:hypothetical protein
LVTVILNVCADELERYIPLINSSTIEQQKFIKITSIERWLK